MSEKLWNRAWYVMVKRIYNIPELLRNPNIPANPNTNSPSPRISRTPTTSAIFQITSSKLYGPVVTLSINDNIKFLEYLKQGIIS